MSITTGLVLIGSCFFIAEMCQLFMRRNMRIKRKPCEWQYTPFFFVLLITLFLVQNIIHFPPLLSIILKFGLLYSGIGLLILFCLFCIRHTHYQSYIFILNWLNRDDNNRHI
ncbi:hypothetical protein ACRS6Y_16750 [Bacillus cytotoxicus]|uniref:Group-specific protein n=1 Tax=Bacillus cytotoxicus (strain DSM 22905 / CIP 110041 / 391-98 / NVH 391-98) TaxID=315749 RepID=A7GPA5_BACCN|nr:MULTISPECIES: hypothetical protein [Bacillus cereus group]ABS21963.1 conserved hypothetical protein [Bacillus cytotoxicus NVH 391-98]AWC28571.1 hypothetical protein CG483_009420 [Bacillus cytotoxicus]AWC32591.1 hypothetical protein CG482_009225 [Bacillus cytotoxicus]AWC36620.1 hypothetical protein CG481_009235 [Bacillus cytotoxicus]AWC40046.1 hypothetical protein CG480_005835 [Bacillus cytotoxicus]